MRKLLFIVVAILISAVLSSCNSTTAITPKDQINQEKPEAVRSVWDTPSDTEQTDAEKTDTGK